MVVGSHNEHQQIPVFRLFVCYAGHVTQVEPLSLNRIELCRIFRRRREVSLNVLNRQEQLTLVLKLIKFYCCEYGSCVRTISYSKIGDLLSVVPSMFESRNSCWSDRTEELVAG